MMDINNANLGAAFVASTAAQAAQKTQQVSPARQLQQPQRSAEPNREQNQDSQQQQAVARLDIDENTIAQLDRENQQRLSVQDQNGNQGANANGNAQEASTRFDSPSSQNLTAIFCLSIG